VNTEDSANPLEIDNLPRSKGGGWIAWMRRRWLLMVFIIVPFFVGGYIWGKSVEDDYRVRPAYDDTEVKWSVIEAYGGAAILFGGVGALVFHLGEAFLSKRD
jgi:hypothetical protein